jgi:hypothetical protein
MNDFKRAVNSDRTCPHFSKARATFGRRRTTGINLSSIFSVCRFLSQQVMRKAARRRRTSFVSGSTSMYSTSQSMLIYLRRLYHYRQSGPDLRRAVIRLLTIETHINPSIGGPEKIIVNGGVLCCLPKGKRRTSLMALWICITGQSLPGLPLANASLSVILRMNSFGVSRIPTVGSASRAKHRNTTV